MSSNSTNYLDRIKKIHTALKIPAEIIRSRQLPLHEDAQSLVFAGFDENGKAHRLTGRANQYWQEMKTAAKKDHVTLLIISGYRSPEYQEVLIRKKLLQGQKLDDILNLLAPPGYSEHHTGRALDLTTPGSEPCEVDFEKTPAFSWLMKRAGDFGFSLSYPKDNRFGFVYEPWHWAHQDKN